MATCLCCSSSKLFMKVNNGLCEDCQKEFSMYEQSYNAILDKIKEPNFNPLPLFPEIINISIHLRKFDNVSKTLKSSDCTDLINTLKELFSSTFLDTVPSTTATSYNINNEQSALKEISKKTLKESFSKESIVDLSNHIVSNFEDDLLTLETLPVEESKEDLKSEKSIDENPTLPMEKESLPIQETLVVQEDFTEPPVENKLKEGAPFLSDSIPPLNHEVLAEVKEILDNLELEKTSIDRRCYYIFILKDKYLSLLKAHNHLIVSDVDVEKIIDDTLAQASILLNCPIDKIYSYYNYVTFGIQTTGMQVRNSSIIELSGVRVSFGEVKEVFSSLINPMHSISLSTEERTLIKNSDLLKAETLDVVLNKFFEFSKGLSLITHNINYNYKFLSYHYERVFKKPLEVFTICSMKLYRSRYKQFHGEPTKDSTLTTCCHDLLDIADLEYINQADSISLSCSLGTYKLYEVIKSRYK